MKRILLVFSVMFVLISICGCEKKEEKKSYVITQYGDYEANQHMFYTIEDEDNNLIIIDGGWDYEADMVRQVIAEHNNRVSAWIITHPHPDHAGAFNVIAQNPDGIVIDEIYTTDVHYERYKATAHWYDMFEVCETFMDITGKMDNVHRVNEGDTFYALGLTFDVVHAWDDKVDTFEANLCNNGSMCFIVKGHDDKMLFCADTQEQVEEDIVSRHKDELDVDYIQLGHHGNWGMTTSFYDNTNPEAVFFDANRGMFESEGYDASDLKKYFETRGVKIYTFETQPNVIEFR